MAGRHPKGTYYRYTTPRNSKSKIKRQKSKLGRFYLALFLRFRLLRQRLQAVIFLPLIVAVWILRCCRRLLATMECEREKLLLGPRSQIGHVLDIEYKLIKINRS